MTARKHDGFRILARKDGNPVKLITRNGYDFADRFPLIVDGIASLPPWWTRTAYWFSTCSAIASMTTRQPYGPSTSLN